MKQFIFFVFLSIFLFLPKVTEAISEPEPTCHIVGTIKYIEQPSDYILTLSIDKVTLVNGKIIENTCPKTYPIGKESEFILPADLILESIKLSPGQQVEGNLVNMNESTFATFSLNQNIWSTIVQYFTQFALWVSNLTS